MEARHPFLDRELVEFLIAIPMEQNYKDLLKINIKKCYERNTTRTNSKAN